MCSRQAAHDFGSMAPPIAPDPNAIDVPGYSHMDPMFASANTPTHRKNDVIFPLIEFVQKTINK